MVFVQIAQIVGKPDLAPDAWVRKLVTLCDQAPATPYNVIRVELERELGKSVEELFERFDINPLGSASIAQVHMYIYIYICKFRSLTCVKIPGVQWIAHINNIIIYRLLTYFPLSSILLLFMSICSIQTLPVFWHLQRAHA